MSLRRSGILLTLTCAALVSTAAASPGKIVPGERIGPVRIGMTRHEAARAQQSAGCQVSTVLSAGKVVQILTPCGGAWATEGGAQVGAPLLLAVREFGQPHTTEEGATYARPGHGTVRAVWYLYRGIGFRAVARDPDPPTAGVVTCVTVYLPGIKPRLPDPCTREVASRG